MSDGPRTSTPFWDATNDGEARRRYRELINSLDDGIFQLDGENRFVAVNDTFLDSMDASRDELLGGPVTDAFEPPSAARIEDAIDRLRGDGGERSQRLEVADGATAESRWELRLSTITEEGDVRRISGVARDITERETGDTDADNTNRYETLVENFPNGSVALFDEDMRYLTAGGDLFDRLDYDPEDRIGATIQELHPPELLEKIEPHFQAALDSRRTSFEIEYRGRHLAATTLPVDTDGDGSRGMLVIHDITERKNRELELERYETVFEALNEGVYVVDAERHFTWVNEAYTEMLGYSREELIGEHVTKVVDADVIREAEMRRGDRGPEHLPRMEVNLRTADGERVPVEAESTVLPGDDPDGWFRAGIVRDISERREWERALEKSEQRYRTLVENFPNGVVALFDEDLRYLTAGGRAFEDIDISTDEIEGDPLSEHVPEELRNTIEPRFQAVFDGEVHEFEMEYGGEVRRVMTVPVRDTDGSIFAGIALSQDVTEQREREEELKRQRERLELLNTLYHVALDINQAIVDETPREQLIQVVCDSLMNVEPYIGSWIGTAEDGSDTVVPRATSTSFRDVEPSRFAEQTGRIAERTLRSGETIIDRDVEADLAPEHPSIDRDDLAVAAVPIRYHGSTDGVLIVCTTGPDAFGEEEREVLGKLGEILGLAWMAIDRKESLQRQRERLELLNRILRHNLLNGLNLVQSRIGMLDETMDRHQEIHLETVRDRTSQMIELTGSLHRLTRGITEQEYELEPVDLGEVLRSEVADVRRAYPDATVELRTDLESAPNVLADELLGELFEKLLINAVQHNDKATPRVEIEVDVTDDAVDVHVSDNGPGVTEPVRKALFGEGERSFENPGTGFGLYLVREMLDVYDGTIEVTDNDPVGTVFSVTLSRPADDT